MVDLISQRIPLSDPPPIRFRRGGAGGEVPRRRCPHNGVPTSANGHRQSTMTDWKTPFPLGLIVLPGVDGFIARDRPSDAGRCLDIDDTDGRGSRQEIVVIGQCCYYDERCYCPLHIYEGRTGRLITTLLRPGARPTGKQIVSILKRLVKILREALWPDVRIFLRGDGHFSCPEVHDFCDEQGRCWDRRSMARLHHNGVALTSRQNEPISGNRTGLRVIYLFRPGR